MNESNARSTNRVVLIRACYSSFVRACYSSFVRACSIVWINPILNYSADCLSTMSPAQSINYVPVSVPPIIK